MLLLQIIWNWKELFFNCFGTYDVTLLITGFVFAALGAILCAVGVISITGQNKTADPTPDPTVVQFMYKNRLGRVVGGFIVVFVVLRWIAPSLTNVSTLCLFSFSVGFFNYLLTESLINLSYSTLAKFFPNLKK